MSKASEPVYLRVEPSRAWDTESPRWLTISTPSGRYLYQVCRRTFERVTGFRIRPGERVLVNIRVTRAKTPPAPRGGES